MTSSLGLPALGHDTQCTPPRWSIPLPLPDEELTTFEAFDDTGRIVFTTRQLAAPRTVTLAEGQERTVRWGEEIQLLWSPHTDELRRQPSLDVLVGGQTVVKFHNVGFHIGEGGAVTMRLPPAPDAGNISGSGELKLHVSQIFVGEERCDPDPENCFAVLEREGEARFHFIPVIFE